jgi:hypothetical protein
MPIVLSDKPRFANSAERRVWEVLIEQLGDDLIIPGKRVTDHLKDHEIDFVVAIAGAGVICVEVKGGEVWHDGHTWRQRRGGQEFDIDPVRQAREACYALRDFVENDPRWTQGRLRWDHAIVLPNTELHNDFALAECPRWKASDRTELPKLASRLRDVLLQQKLDRPMITSTGIEQLNLVLSGAWPTAT